MEVISPRGNERKINVLVNYPSEKYGINEFGENRIAQSRQFRHMENPNEGVTDEKRLVGVCERTEAET